MIVASIPAAITTAAPSSATGLDRSWKTAIPMQTARAARATDAGEAARNH